jgi:hypothetical protein
MTEPTQSLGAVAALGTEMQQILASEAFKTGVLLTRAQIYEEWCNAHSPIRLARLKAEQEALDRLLQAFETIHTNGMIAQEAIRRENAGLDTELA